MNSDHGTPLGQKKVRVASKFSRRTYENRLFSSRQVVIGGLLSAVSMVFFLVGCKHQALSAADRDSTIDQILERSGTKGVLESIDRGFHESLERNAQRLERAAGPENARRAQEVWTRELQLADMYGELKRIFGEALTDDELPAALAQVTSAERTKVQRISTRGGYDDLSYKERLEQIVNGHPSARLELVKKLNDLTGQDAVNVQLALIRWVVLLQIMTPDPPTSELDEERKKLQADVEESARLQAIEDLYTANAQVTDDQLKEFIRVAKAHPQVTDALRRGLIAAVTSARERALADVRNEAAATQ